MKSFLSIPTFILNLELSITEMLILTVIYIRQDYPESLSISKIAKLLKINNRTVQRAVKKIKSNNYIIDPYIINISNEGKGHIVHLWKIVHDIPKLNLNEKVFLSLILEDWNAGYFCMKNNTIQQRLKLSDDTIRKYINKFEDYGWITVERISFFNGPIYDEHTFKKSRKIYPIIDQIKKSSEKYSKLNESGKYFTSGNLREMQETIKLDDGVLLNYWVHSRNIDYDETLRRARGAELISVLAYFSYITNNQSFYNLTHSILEQACWLANSGQLDGNNKLCLITYWYTEEFDKIVTVDIFKDEEDKKYGKCGIYDLLPNKLKRELINGNRSITLFFNPLVMEKNLSWLRNINDKEKIEVLNKGSIIRKDKDLEECINNRKKDISSIMNR